VKAQVLNPDRVFQPGETLVFGVERQDVIVLQD
jgi:hypothetical protein